MAGGAEVNLHEIAKRWVKWGHQVTLFCSKYRGCKENEEIDGIEIIRKGGPYTVYLHAARQYLWRLKKERYGIIIDDINGVPFFTPTYVREPKVAILHHLVKDIFFKELGFPLAIPGYLAEMAIPLIYQEIPFVAVSESTKESLTNFGIPPENITVIYNGLNHSVYKTSSSLESPFPHVVYVGRIKNYKNLDHLLRATKILAKTIPNVRLSIAGKGDCNGLKVLAKQLRIAHLTSFYTNISDQEKVQLLQSAWVHVTPSIREGWGLTIMEAAACGVPAVAYDVPGSRDAIVKNETGLLVPYGEVETLAKAVLRTLTDYDLRETLSRNAVEWSRRFSWEQTATETLQVVKTAIELNGSHALSS